MTAPDWPIPDEVVRELARFVVVECLGATEECVVPSDFDRARAFLERHRLVQLPEEPDGWLDPVCRNGVPGINTMAYYLTREKTTPQDCAAYVLCIPGQPITVGEEERDGQA